MRTLLVALLDIGEDADMGFRPYIRPELVSSLDAATT
jgi:hypothetical protein